MNIYTKQVANAAEFSMMRGVTDFTNAKQFNLYESGYAHLVVISKPKCISENHDSYVENLLKVFCYILEYEFKGLSGIDDITTDELEVTDGVSTLKLMGKSTKQSASEITMSFTEKSGSAITNFIKFYIEGIRDPRTQAKTYHGLIANGTLAPGFENEVFNLLYIVTDNTMLQLEKAYLLCNAWPTSAKTSIYETEKGTIDKKDIDVTFQCFVLDGPQIDKRALEILAFINEGKSVSNVYEKMKTTAKGTPISLADIGSITAKDGVDRTVHLISGDVTDTTKTVKEFTYDIQRDGNALAKYEDSTKTDTSTTVNTSTK